MYHPEGLKGPKTDDSALCTRDFVIAKATAGNFSRSTISSRLTFSGARLTAGTASPCLPACLSFNDVPSYRVHNASFPLAFAPNGYGGWTIGVRIWVTAAPTWIHAASLWQEIRLNISQLRSNGSKESI